MTSSTVRGTSRRLGTLLSVSALLAVCGPARLAAAAPASPVPTTSQGTTATPSTRPATFGIGPSDGRSLDRRSQLNFLASPGSTVTDHVAVVNLATTAATLRVYAADATSAADGSVGYQPRAASRTGLAAWLTARTPGTAGTVVVPARGRVVLPLSVRVPTNATPGDHVAGVVASLTSRVKNSRGELIDFEQRVALRTSVRVSGTLSPRLAVENLHADYAGTLNPFGSGRATVTYTVHNTGNVALGSGQRVSVSGLFGEDTAPSVASLPLLLPDATARMTVVVPDVAPAVRLTARVSLYPLAVKGDVNPTLPRAFSATSGLWAVPWSLLALVVLLALATVAALVHRRRRARRPVRGRHSHAATPALS